MVFRTMHHDLAGMILGLISIGSSAMSVDKIRLDPDDFEGNYEALLFSACRFI